MTTTLYKLTDQDGYTMRGMPGETLWKIDTPVTATGRKKQLCSDGVIHAYHDPIVGLFMNPNHANFKSPRLWEAEGKVVVDDGIKVGTRTLTLTRELPVPEITINQRARFAILCAKELPELPPEWKLWADKWLSGEDRTARSAEAAATAAWAAAEAAARAARAAAEAAARAAARAARAAAEAAARAARAAATAAWAATAVKERKIDLAFIARKAMEDEK